MGIERGVFILIWLYIACAIILFILLLVFSKLHITISYAHIKDNDKLDIKVRIWFFHYTFHVPLIRVDKDTESVVVATEKKEEEPKSKQFTSHEILNSFQDMKEILQHVVTFHRIVRQFLKKVTVHKFSWHTNIGIGDAALTGVLVGVAWAIKGNIVGLLSRYMKVKKIPEMSITPLFVQVYSQTKLTCMISFRIGNAILAGLRIVKFWKGGKPKLKNSPPFLKEEQTEKSMS